jgi:hypothetical protein
MHPKASTFVHASTKGLSMGSGIGVSRADWSLAEHEPCAELLDDEHPPAGASRTAATTSNMALDRNIPSPPCEPCTRLTHGSTVPAMGGHVCGHRHRHLCRRDQSSAAIEACAKPNNLTWPIEYIDSHRTNQFHREEKGEPETDTRMILLTISTDTRGLAADGGRSRDTVKHLKFLNTRHDHSAIVCSLE